MKVTIPELALVVLIGPSGSGKSSFARKHFKPTEVLSSDYCRGLVSDDENDQAATTDAFEVLHFVARKRLAAGKLTVVDATNVQPEARKPLVQLARDFHCLPVAMVFNLPEHLCHERNRGRTDRDFGPHVIRQQTQQLRRGLRGLEREGYTRTGRRFFDDSTLEKALLSIVGSALTAAGFWDEFGTDWVCLDAELMPWSAKAQALLRGQYAAVGAAARAALNDVVATLQLAVARGVDVAGLLADHKQRRTMTRQYVEAYQRYCWPVTSVMDLKLAPFHLLATKGRVHVDKDHVWHMTTLARLCSADAALLLATPYKVVDVTDETSQSEGIRWWEELTTAGGEGMVVKPMDFIVRGRRGLVQPAIKCRGREYLRIIYGPEYTAPKNLERLRSRGLSSKRSLAIREFALGIEALERFVRREPLRRVHECVFGVLALESEPVDPRL
jgi:predicted kinase